MNPSELIHELYSVDLYAECNYCDEEFRLSEAALFDGCGAFPEAAEAKRKEMLDELNLRTEELKRRRISADVGAEKKAIEVGIGKIIEKIVPAYAKFGIPLGDCRPLFEPIDLIVFNGMSKMRVDSITFLEIKTGEAKINQHERMVRDAINDKKLTYRVM
jgi:predicted Holliday junction resolvase-like endonuclease